MDDIFVKRYRDPRGRGPTRIVPDLTEKLLLIVIASLPAVPLHYILRRMYVELYASNAGTCNVRPAGRDAFHKGRHTCTGLSLPQPTIHTDSSRYHSHRRSAAPGLQPARASGVKPSTKNVKLKSKSPFQGPFRVISHLISEELTNGRHTPHACIFQAFVPDTRHQQRGRFLDRMSR